jgi:predicted class III extradiol MEMO1 family dioxygenase
MFCLLAVTEALKRTGKFTEMSQSTDEDEHSIEMHLPYIKKAMGKYAGLGAKGRTFCTDLALHNWKPAWIQFRSYSLNWPGLRGEYSWHRRQEFTVIPILVGALSDAREKEYGTLLAPYLDDPQNLWVVSSDFCHWCAPYSVL